MSESMAFVGGVAVAGLAALLLLKGTGNPIQQPNFVASQVPATMVQPGMVPPAATYPGMQNLNPLPVDPNSNQLRLDNDRQKMQLEAEQRDIEQLKAQNQQLQSVIGAYNVQAQQNSHNAALQSQSPWWSSGIIWAVGGMALTIGGGIVVAGVTNLFSPKQRPTRTVQVIHPYNAHTTPLPPVRRAEFLPPRTEARRVENAEYEDLY